jgi:hypothetical protein
MLLGPYEKACNYGSGNDVYKLRSVVDQWLMLSREVLRKLQLPPSTCDYDEGQDFWNLDLNFWEEVKQQQMVEENKFLVTLKSSCAPLLPRCLLC